MKSKMTRRILLLIAWPSLMSRQQNAHANSRHEPVKKMDRD